MQDMQDMYSMELWETRQIQGKNTKINLLQSNKN